MVQPAPPAAWRPGNSVSVEPSANALRLPAALVALGEVSFILVGLLHPAHEDPNNHPAVFAEYAASTLWGGVHLGQFLTMAADPRRTRKPVHGRAVAWRPGPDQAVKRTQRRCS